MGIGTGVLLIALGAVLAWAIDVDLPLIDDDGMGLILVFAGIAVLLISVILRANRPSAGIGTGVALIAAGSVVAWAIDIDVPFITDSVFGGILITAGLIAVVAVVAINVMQRRAARPPQPDESYPPRSSQGGYPTQRYDDYPPQSREAYPPRPYDEYPREPQPARPYDNYPPQPREAYPPRPYDDYPREPQPAQPYDNYYEPQRDVPPPPPQPRPQPQYPEPPAPPSNQPPQRYSSEPTQVFEQPRDNPPPSQPPRH